MVLLQPNYSLHMIYQLLHAALIGSCQSQVLSPNTTTKVLDQIHTVHPNGNETMLM